MSMRIGLTRSRVIVVGTALVMVGTGSAVAAAGTAQTTSGSSSSLLPTVTRTIEKVVDKSTGKVAESLNYTVNVKPQARSTSTDTYGNPLQNINVQSLGLPSIPG